MWQSRLADPPAGTSRKAAKLLIGAGAVSAALVGLRAARIDVALRYARGDGYVA